MSDALQTLIEFGIPMEKASFALAAKNQNLEAAIAWCFDEGVNWEGPSSSSAPPLPSAPPSAPVHGPTLPNSASNPIDVDIPPLIHDNPDDISRAVELSMQSSQQQQSQPPPPSPSQQPLPPPPAYPQSLPPTSTSAEDAQINQAPQASSFLPAQPPHSLPLPPNLPREPDTPTVLYTPQSFYAYAACILQALSAVPQFSEVMNAISGMDDKMGPRERVAADLLSQISNLVKSMSTSSSSYIEISGLIKAANINFASGHPAISCEKLLRDIVDQVWISGAPVMKLESSSIAGESEDELLDATGGLERSFISSFFHQTGGLVTPSASPDDDTVANLFVEAHPSPEVYTTHTALSSTLWNADEDAPPSAFRTMSEVLVVTVQPGKEGIKKRLFEPEEEFWIDPFLKCNAPLCMQLRANDGLLRGEEESLIKKRHELTTVQGKDVRQNLVTAIKFYQTVRPGEEKGTLDQLESILAAFDKELESLSSQITAIVAKRKAIFDLPELQRCKYILRSAIFWNGLGQLSTCVKVDGGDGEAEGQWWKIVEEKVHKTTYEAGLKDSLGLLIGAGPLMLFYSKSDDWPIEMQQAMDDMEMPAVAPEPAQSSPEPATPSSHIPYTASFTAMFP